MSRRAGCIALVVLLVLISPVGAADAESALREVRAFVFLAKRHDRLWSWVDQRIGSVTATVDAADEKGSLIDLHYRFLLDWARSRDLRKDEERVSALIGIYGRALGLGLPVPAIARAREGLVHLRLGEAERLRALGADLGTASDHVQSVLAMDGLSDVLRDRAMNLGFRIDSHEAERLLAAGDLTRGYDRLAEVIERYGGMDLAALSAARDKLDTLARTTGDVTIRLFDAGDVLSGANAAIVGEIVALPGLLRIHRRLDDYRVSEAPVAVAPLSLDEPLHLRLLLTEGARFVVRVGFPDGRRPDLRLPIDLSGKTRTVRLPDRIPLRMAFVPESSGVGAYFIGLYEVSVGEFNAYLQSTGQGPRRGVGPGLPVDDVGMADVTRFLTFAGASLPTRREWTRAAVGDDRRPLPWGAGNKAVVRARAHIDSWPAGPEEVMSRGADVGPYGLHHVLGNVWELVEGGFAMGGSRLTPYPLKLTYRRADSNEDATFEPDLLREPRPLAPAGETMAPGDEMRRMWKEVLFNPEDPGVARVKQPGIGFRVVIR